MSNEEIWQRVKAYLVDTYGRPLADGLVLGLGAAAGYLTYRQTGSVKIGMAVGFATALIPWSLIFG